MAGEAQAEDFPGVEGGEVSRDEGEMGASEKGGHVEAVISSGFLN